MTGWHRYGDHDAATRRARLYAATAVDAYSDGDHDAARLYADLAADLARMTGDRDAADLAATVTRWRAEAMAEAEATP